MSRESSTFIRETRERESWLSSAAAKEGEADAEGLLATAALLRGALSAIPVPETAEEECRARAVALLQEMQLQRSRRTAGSAGPIRAPWYLRLGHVMRFVFTLGRRR